MQGDAGQPGAGFLAAAGSRLPSRMCLVVTGTSSPCAGRHGTLKMTPARVRDPTCTNTAQTAGAARAQALNGPGTASLPWEQMRTGGGENSKRHPCARGTELRAPGLSPSKRSRASPSYSVLPDGSKPERVGEITTT